MRIAIPVFETPTACAGAAAAYVLRRVAYRAGAYAPGIHEAIFDELHTPRAGAALDDVQRWFADRVAALGDLGYRLQCRRVAEPTALLLAWVQAGCGYRGAVLATRYETLHPTRAASVQAGQAIAHAVGVANQGREAGGDGSLVMIDPWSRTDERRGPIHPELATAHGEREHDALAIYWVGWS